MTIKSPGSEVLPDRSALSFGSLISFVLAVGVGTLAAVILIPTWVPNLLQTLEGTDPKAYWYLARGAGFISIGLLWISMALGLLITNKIARNWPGSAAAFAIHEYVSLLGMAFAIFHALILLGDHYIKYTVAQILMPFGSVNYHPAWVGLGQIGFYVWSIVSLSFYIRKQIGPKVWHLIHFASFFTFAIAILHGIGAGTDASLPWVHNYYWFLAVSLVFLTIYRILADRFPEKRPVRQPAPPSSAPRAQPPQ